MGTYLSKQLSRRFRQKEGSSNYGSENGKEDVGKPQDHYDLTYKINIPRPQIHRVGLPFDKYCWRQPKPFHDYQPRCYTSGNTPRRDIMQDRYHNVSAFKLNIPRPQIHFAGLPFDIQPQSNRQNQSTYYTNGHKTPGRDIQRPRHHNVSTFQFNIPRPQIYLPFDKYLSRHPQSSRAYQPRRRKRGNTFKFTAEQRQRHENLVLKLKIPRPKIRANQRIYKGSSKRSSSTYCFEKANEEYQSTDTKQNSYWQDVIAPGRGAQVAVSPFKRKGFLQKSVRS